MTKEAAKIIENIMIGEVSGHMGMIPNSPLILSIFQASGMGFSDWLIDIANGLKNIEQENKTFIRQAKTEKYFNSKDIEKLFDKDISDKIFEIFSLKNEIQNIENSIRGKVKNTFSNMPLYSDYNISPSVEIQNSTLKVTAFIDFSAYENKNECYKDKTFCIKSDICTNNECDRKLSERDKEAIKEYDLLVSWSDCSTIECINI